MEILHDPELGKMSFDGVWTLDERVSFNGAQIPLEIEPETPDTLMISPLQRRAALLALALTPESLAQAAPAVIQNYDVYREQLGDELPPLGDPMEVWQSVAPTSILIPRHFDAAEPCFFLQAECDWDPEHGLTVRFRNGLADAASQQGDLGLED